MSRRCAAMARSRSISRKLRSFLAVGPRRQLLVIEAIMHLAVSRITLLVMPFERL